MWTFGKKLTLGFALASLLLVAVGVISYANVGSLIDSNRQLLHSQAILRASAALLSVV